jgi:hypothetical protein
MCILVSFSLGILPIFMGSNVTVFAAENKSDTVLSGVKDMYALVELKGHEVGLTANQLEKDMAQELHRGGIKVVPRGPPEPTQKQPFVSLIVRISQCEDGTYACNTWVQLWEKIRPLRKPDRTFWATTWQSRVFWGHLDVNSASTIMKIAAMHRHN